MISHGLQLSFGVLLVVILRRWDPEYAAVPSASSATGSDPANPYSAASFVSSPADEMSNGDNGGSFVTVSSSSSVVAHSEKWIQTGRRGIIG